ncbi:MAG: IS4 family transposase [Nitrososphaera sp.]|uniref:IS4 family transposase n=1 Tax=Nitrososphaera sp. TaxID=1971748 RepID=UPI003D6EA55B
MVATPMTHNISRALQTVFTNTADVAARQTGFVQRESKLDGGTFVQTLTFGWLHNPHATLEELAQTAGNLGVPISPQGLDQRFGPRAAALLERVLHDAVVQVISADPVAVPLLQRFPGGVCLLDSTTLTLPEAFAGAWPGSGSHEAPAGIKAQVRLNLLDGTLHGPFLFPARDHDQTGVLHHAPLPPGTLHLADLGFFSLQRLQTLHQQGVSWLTRVQVRTALFDASGQEWTLAAFLSRQASDTVDVPVTLGAELRLPCRLLAARVPEAVAEKRRQRIRRRVRKGGKIHPDSLALAAWTIYATNIPAENLSLQEAWVLARCRWQIELLFKLWKSEGHIDESRSGKPWRILCEVYAKLLAMVVQHWVLLGSCWSHANRSLVKASRTVRMHALSLAVVLHQRHLVNAVLANVKRCLAVGCRVNRRRRDPPSHLLLLGLAEIR